MHKQNRHKRVPGYELSFLMRSYFSTKQEYIIYMYRVHDHRSEIILPTIVSRYQRLLIVVQWLDYQLNLCILEQEGLSDTSISE